MTQIYFHYSNAQNVLVDRHGSTVGDLAEAQDYAALVVRSLISAPNLEDWRDWVLHVSDNLGHEIFVMPFEELLGKPH